jgi:hypothetical protein
MNSLPDTSQAASGWCNSMVNGFCRRVIDALSEAAPKAVGKK